MDGPRSVRLSILLVPWLLIGSVLLPACPAHGQGVDETTADSWVESDYNISFTAFDRITVSVTMWVHETDLDMGGGVPATDLRAILSTDPSAMDRFLEGLARNMTDTVNRSLDALEVENSTMTVEEPVISDLGENVTGDPYNDPVVLVGGIDIVLPPSSLDLPATSSVHDLVLGTLKMGGRMNISLELNSGPGHLNTFRFSPPPGTVLMAGQAKTTQQVFPLDARGSEVDLTVGRSLVFAHSVPRVPGEEVEVTGRADVRALDDVGTVVNISMGAVDASRISEHFPEVLGMDVVSADGIRMAVENDLLSWDWIYEEFIRPEEVGLEGDLGETMEGPVDLVFGWVEGSLEGYDVDSMDGPPVRAILTHNGSLDLYGMSPRVASAALDSGAEVPFEVPIGTDLDWSLQVVLPTGLSLEDSTVIPSERPDGRLMYTWTEVQGVVSGLLTGAGTIPDSYGEMDYHLDLVGADTDLGRILGEGTTTVRFDIDVRVSVEAVPLTGDLSGAVPLDIYMLVADADFLRTLLAEGVVQTHEVEAVLEGMGDVLSDRVSAVVGTRVDLRLYLEKATMDANATGPIMVRASATASKEKDLDSLNNTALNVIEVGHRFPLQGVHGWLTKYTITMPEGVEINRAVRERDDTGPGDHPPRISEDRRSYTEVLEGNISDNVTLYAEPTLAKAFSEAIVQPICLGPTLLVIGVIITSTFLLRRRRSRQKEGERRELEGLRKVRGRRETPRERGAWDEEAMVGPGTSPREGAVTGEGAARGRARRTAGRRGGGISGQGTGARHRGRTPPTDPRTQEQRREGVKRKGVRCPRCGRKFTVDPRYPEIVCPHCGKRGRMTVDKGYRQVKCPACGNMIRYGPEDRRIRCDRCGKEGRVRRRR